MFVVAAVRAGAFRVRVEIESDVEGAETAGLFVAFADSLEFWFEVEVFDVGEVATSEAAHARDTAGTVGEALAHAGTGGHAEVAVVVELRIDGAGIGHGEVSAIAVGGARRRAGRRGMEVRGCVHVAVREFRRGGR